jgi:hypothetical protein
MSVRRTRPERTYKPPKGTDPPRTVFMVKSTEGGRLPATTGSKRTLVVRRVPVPGGGAKPKKMTRWINTEVPCRDRLAILVIDRAHTQRHLELLTDGEDTRWWAANVRKVEDGLLAVPKGWSPHPEVLRRRVARAPVTRTVWYVVYKTRHGWHRRGYLYAAQARYHYRTARRYGHSAVGYTLTMGNWTYAHTRAPVTELPPEELRRVRALYALHAHSHLTTEELCRASGYQRVWEDTAAWLREQGATQIRGLGWVRAGGEARAREAVRLAEARRYVQH